MDSFIQQKPTTLRSPRLLIANKLFQVVLIKDLKSQVELVWLCMILKAMNVSVLNFLCSCEKFSSEVIFVVASDYMEVRECTTFWIKEERTKLFDRTSKISKCYLCLLLLLFKEQLNTWCQNLVLYSLSLACYHTNLNTSYFRRCVNSIWFGKVRL